MGALMSKFWKKKSSLEELEELELTIAAIEEYNNNVEQRQKTIGRLFYYGVILFSFTACAFAYIWKLRNFKEQMLFTLFLFGLFIVSVYLKKIVNWYYVRKIKKNRSKLFDIRQKKKEMIDTVMEKETYKVAREILEKFAPEKVTNKIIYPRNEIALLSQRNKVTNAAPSQRPLQLVPVTQNKLNTGLIMPQPAIGSGFMPSVLTSRVDRILEYLIGDGPSQRYALICKSCHTHNGMALKEEFPYTGFRCCSCQTLNPPRMLRPIPPQLLDSTVNSTDDIKDDVEVTECDSVNSVNESETSNGTSSTVPLEEAISSPVPLKEETLSPELLEEEIPLANPKEETSAVGDETQ